MKKIIALLVTFAMLFTGAVSATTPEFQTVMTDNVDDLILWIQTEDIATFQEGRYQNGITSLREKGELFIPSYQGSLMELKQIEVLGDQAGDTPILYRFSSDSQRKSIQVIIKEVNPANEHLLAQGPLSYFEAQYDSLYSKEGVEGTTIRSDNQETISFVTYEVEPQGQYGIGAKNSYFVSNGYEVMVSQNVQTWDVAYLSELSLDVLPFAFDESHVNGGMGDILIAKNSIENTFSSTEHPITVEQRDVDTQAEAKEAVETIIQQGSTFDTTWQVIDGTFTPAIAATTVGSTGTNGSYTFTVTLTKGTHPQKVTKPLTLIIVAPNIHVDPIMIVKKPTISPTVTMFSSSQKIILSCETEGAEIYYTTNGATPTVNSTKYTGPFVIVATTTIKAIAVKADMSDSEVLTVVMIKQNEGGGGGGDSTPTPSPTPTVSPSAEPTPSPTPTVSPSAEPTPSPTPTVSPSEEPSPSPEPPTEELPFVDIDGHWAADAITWAFENHLLSGTSEDRFEPDTPMSRAMLVTVLWRLNGQPSSNGTLFSDVESGQWYSQAISWASEGGIVYGVGDGQFMPGTEVTREQLAVILYRYEQYIGITPPQILTDLMFYDWEDLSNYAKDPVSALVGQGIIAGKPDHLFDPKGTATRAEMASVLYRFVKAIETQ